MVYHTGTPADGTARPDCEFSFDTVHTLFPGDCITSADVVIDLDEDPNETTFLSYYTSTYGYELGPFPATLTPGAAYDSLYFTGHRTFFRY